jgi:hypothetical protein
MKPFPRQPIDIHFDTETGDPDDLCTLLLLLAHPAYRLRSVSVTPGTDEQVGMLKSVLARCGASDIPVGSAVPGHDKRCVSKFYYDWLGTFESQPPDMGSTSLVMQSLATWPELTLLTGAPLKGLRGLSETQPIHRWVAQGGFAGDKVVPAEFRLEKFAGKDTCPTYNFNGDVQTAFKLLQNPNIGERILVSKNVCHGMVYDMAFHQAISVLQGTHPAWDLLLKGMEIYLERHEGGKKFHDPLAAAVAAQPDICTFREVKLYRVGGGWGSELSRGSGTWISVSADRARLIAFLVGDYS